MWNFVNKLPNRENSNPQHDKTLFNPRFHNNYCKSTFHDEIRCRNSLKNCCSNSYSISKRRFTSNVLIKKTKNWLLNAFERTLKNTICMGDMYLIAVTYQVDDVNSQLFLISSHARLAAAHGRLSKSRPASVHDTYTLQP